MGSNVNIIFYKHFEIRNNIIILYVVEYHLNKYVQWLYIQNNNIADAYHKLEGYAESQQMRIKKKKKTVAVGLTIDIGVCVQCK